METLLDIVRDPRWSPYAAGAGIGILSWLVFLLSNQALGVSSALANTAGMIEIKIRGKRARLKEYYTEHPPVIDWEWMLVVGLFCGALVAAWASGTFQWEWVPPMWSQTFGPGIGKRLAVAIAGGIFIGFGARWGCGCTSGHGISGALQLVLSSWLAALCFFLGGMITAMILY
jgi:uncharacterized membrane protein YedE/YeeE